MQALTTRRAVVLCFALALSAYCYAQNLTIGNALPCGDNNLSCVPNEECYTRDELCNGIVLCSPFREDEGNVNIVNSLDCTGDFGLYRCNNGTQVLTLDLLCDGNADCMPGGDDETNPFCANKCRLPFYGGCSFTRQCISSSIFVNCGACLAGYVENGLVDCLAANVSGSGLPMDATVTIGFTREEYLVTESEGSARIFVERHDIILDRDIPFNIITITGPGEAVAGEDYETVAPRILMFEMSLDSDMLIGVDITILDDTVVENRECFYAVIISSNSYVVVNPSMARVCIDDDDSVVIEPEDPSYTVPEGPPVQTIRIPIVLRGMKEPGIECNVTVHTEDGSAITGEDYIANWENFTFSADDPRQIFQVIIIDDLTSTPELDEIFTVSVSSSDDNCLAGTPAIVIITDNVDGSCVSAGFTSCCDPSGPISCFILSGNGCFCDQIP